MQQEISDEEAQRAAALASLAAGAPDTGAGKGIQDAMQAVLIKCQPMPDDAVACRGHDFDKDGDDIQKILQSFMTTGFQATEMGRAVERLREMISWRLSDEPVTESTPDDLKDEATRQNTKARIFLGYTSNMVSSGSREVIKYLCKHNMVDAIVTTAGGIEEDFMKCYAPHYMGEWSLRGRDLRLKGHNRIGNLVVPNDNYCSFEDFLTPILKDMARAQKEDGIIWTPSKMIDRLGAEIAHEDSVYYWCHRNNIPVFCPAITDGSVGDMVFFQAYNEPDFIIDIAQDIRAINDIALSAPRSGMLILGGGLVKHHICNANLMRNGADWSVFVNTAISYDGSDSGAPPDEAVSWGKIRLDARPVKVFGECTVMLPLLVAGSFYKLRDIAPRNHRDPLYPECVPADVKARAEAAAELPQF